MKTRNFLKPAAFAFSMLITPALPSAALSQDISLVTLDVKDIATGVRAENLKMRMVSNEQGERIGKIDDFIFTPDGTQIFAVIAVGDYTGLDGNLIAVPFTSLKIDDRSSNVVLPGASRAELLKLPVFLYKK